MKSWRSLSDASPGVKAGYTDGKGDPSHGGGGVGSCLMTVSITCVYNPPSSKGSFER